MKKEDLQLVLKFFTQTHTNGVQEANDLVQLHFRIQQELKEYDIVKEKESAKEEKNDD